MNHLLQPSPNLHCLPWPPTQYSLLVSLHNLTNLVYRSNHYMHHLLQRSPMLVCVKSHPYLRSLSSLIEPGPLGFVVCLPNHYMNHLLQPSPNLHCLPWPPTQYSLLVSLHNLTNLVYRSNHYMHHLLQRSPMLVCVKSHPYLRSLSSLIEPGPLGYPIHQFEYQHMFRWHSRLNLAQLVYQSNHYTNPMSQPSPMLVCF